MSDASERLERWRQKKRKGGYRYIGLWVEGHVKGQIDELAWRRQQTPGDAVRDAVVKLLAAEETGGGDLRLEPRQEHRMEAKIREDILKQLAAAGAIRPAVLSTPSVVVPPLRPPPPAGMVSCRKGHDPHPEGKECPACVRDRQQRFRDKQQAQGQPSPAPHRGDAAPQPEGPVGCPPFDTTKYRLGKLCPQKHAWGDTGQSLRAANKAGYCLACNKAMQETRRAR
jgi:hypothetical protein